MLIMMFIFLPRAWVSANRIMEVIQTPYKINDQNANQEHPNKDVEVEFRNVCFKYPNAEECVIKKY